MLEDTEGGITVYEIGGYSFERPIQSVPEIGAQQGTVRTVL